MGPVLIIAIVIASLVLLAILFVIGQFFNLWIQALFSGAKVSFFELIGMRLRKVDPNEIVGARIQAVKAGLPIGTNQLETHFMAVGRRRGRVMNVVNALIAADRAKIELPWETACAIDLAGRNIFDAVNTSVNPKVIDCPSPGAGRPTIDAVAQDGIQLKARARVTVRANIAMQKGLDAGTAFEILSIDIADIDVGENIGAKLQADQAEADKRRFQAEAEKRRAMAVAQEQEMHAKVAENRALVVLAEAEIPKAMAESFRAGNLGIMDYYRMKNVMADTEMRASIANTDERKQNDND